MFSADVVVWFRSPAIMWFISSPSRLKLCVVYWENIEGAREERRSLEYWLVGLGGICMRSMDVVSRSECVLMVGLRGISEMVCMS